MLETTTLRTFLYAVDWARYAMQPQKLRITLASRESRLETALSAQLFEWLASVVQSLT